MELQPKIKQVFNDVNDYSVSYNTLERENDNMKREIKSLITRNQNLNNELKELKRKIELIFIKLKEHLRELLQYGNDKVKDLTSNQIMNYYMSEDISQKDVYHIAKETTKEDDLFEFSRISSYNKNYPKQNIREHTKSKDNEISL